jgi:hypothetical protein
MTAAANLRYINELRARFGYTPTWLPNTPVRLGDVGVLSSNGYERLRSLADFGISFHSRDSISSGSLEYISASEVSVMVKQEGQLPVGTSSLAQADGGITVIFGGTGAVLFQAAGCSISSIEDQHLLSDRLLALHAEGRWNIDYVVVTELVQAERTSVLISSANFAAAEFKVNGSFLSASLVSANTDLKLIRSHNIGTQIVMEGGLTPLFKAKGIRRRFLRPPNVVSRGDSTVCDTGESLILDYVDYQDYRTNLEE